MHLQLAPSVLDNSLAISTIMFICTYSELEVLSVIVM